MKTSVIAAALLVSLGVAAAAVALWPAPEIRLKPQDTALVQEGRRLYDEHCARCHGMELEGQPDWRSRLPNGRLPAPPHDETGHTWHHPDAMLFDITKHGMAAVAPPDYETDMPAYGEILGDREILAVLSYIKSRWPQETQRRHDGLNAR